MNSFTSTSNVFDSNLGFNSTTDNSQFYHRDVMNSILKVRVDSSLNQDNYQYPPLDYNPTYQSMQTNISQEVTNEHF